MTNQQSVLDLCWATCERVKTFWGAIFFLLAIDTASTSQGQINKVRRIGLGGGGWWFGGSVVLSTRPNSLRKSYKSTSRLVGRGQSI